jgi:hypothetical protein
MLVKFKWRYSILQAERFQPYLVPRARRPQTDAGIGRYSHGPFSLVVAPFWIGAVYLAAISVFSNSRPFIFFLFLILLGESHFGTTWLFFLVRENRRWVWERRGRLVYLPLVMTGAYVLIGATNLEAAILIGGLPPVFT